MLYLEFYEILRVHFAVILNSVLEFYLCFFLSFGLLSFLPTRGSGSRPRHLDRAGGYTESLFIAIHRVPYSLHPGLFTGGKCKRLLRGEQNGDQNIPTKPKLLGTQSVPSTALSLSCDEYYCQLTKRMMSLVEEEESVKDMQEPVLVERLTKLLMMSINHRLNVMKLNELKRSFGFPDDYLIRIVPKHPEMFRIVNYSGRRSAMEIELLSWNPDLGISVIESLAHSQGSDPRFSCTLPSTWVKSWERFCEFNATPYISPYLDASHLVEGSKEMEKRIVGLVHELLSLTLWKKLSIVKLGHFRREFGLPEKLNVLLLKHPGIFYVSNRYQIYTVLLREGYNGNLGGLLDPEERKRFYKVLFDDAAS
ncbi:unnamed protein product, partial [Vitis vinifera]